MRIPFSRRSSNPGGARVEDSLTTRLAAAARAQTANPGGRVSDPRQPWRDRAPDVWAVSVQGHGRTALAAFRVTGERASVPAGPAQAARELQEMRVLDEAPWGGGLIYLVVAAGGATPGFPDVWDTSEEPRADGGIRITVRAAQEWIEYAASGGAGPVPNDGATPVPGAAATTHASGRRPTSPTATATLDIAPDYSLAWRYQLGGDERAGLTGAPAPAPPRLPEDRLVSALDAARAAAGAPRAMPASEPYALESSAVVVELWQLGRFEVA